MDDDVQNLVLAPFCDAIAKGKTAAQNAEAASSQAMQKAALSLVSSGERALKKMEPLCRRQLDECGAHFVDALKENDEISSFRERLNEMLWDLDDCVDPDGFDPDVYAKLQALLRTAALRTADIIVRMKLERAPRETLKTPQAEPERLDPPREASAVGTEPPVSPRDIPAPPPLPPPPPPAANPWLDPVPSEVDADVVDGWIERRPRIEAAGESEEGQPRADSPTYGQRVASVPVMQPEETAFPDAGPVSPHIADRRSTASLPSRRALSDAIPHSSPRYSQTSSINSSLPERLTRDSLISPLTEVSEPARQASSALASPITPTSATTPPPQHYRRWPLPEPTTPTADTTPTQPGLEATLHSFEDGLIPVGPESSTPRVDSPAEAELCAITPSSSFHQLGSFCRGADAVMSGLSGIKLVKQPVSALGSSTVTSAKCKHCMFELDWARVRADHNKDSAATYTSSSGIEFRLRFLSKSHLAAKRIDDQLYACIFCVRAGRTLRPTDATVFFSQRELLAHIARHPRPFAPGLSSGLTIVESDGGEGGGGVGGVLHPAVRNNFDLHFTRPPVASAMVGLERELARLPWGIATEMFRPATSGGRLPPDRAAVLSCAKGAVLGGVEFPARYGGEWAVAWADDVRGAVPAECLRLRAPTEVGFIEKMRAASKESGLTAVARWKRTQKDDPPDGAPEFIGGGKGAVGGTPWLRFPKGEVLTNIAFPYPEFWCWAGCNSKGKWGVFPHVFTEAGSLAGAEPGDGEGSASVWSSESAGTSIRGSGGKGLLARLTGRKRWEGRDKKDKDNKSGGSGELGPEFPKPTVY